MQDEPTSGLDATAATDILTALRRCGHLLTPEALHLSPIRAAELLHLIRLPQPRF